MEDAIKKSSVLIEALPYIRNFRGKTFVIKYGGSILSESRVRKSVLEDIVFLYFTGINVILVHGGGPSITEGLKRAGLKSKFHEGIRITDRESLHIVEEELIKLNQLIVSEIEKLGAKCKGINGKDDVMLVKKKTSETDFGYVGTITGINKVKLDSLIAENHIIILAPMGKNSGGEAFNVNADEAASFIAGEISAKKLVLLTNVEGVKRNRGREEKDFISSITEQEIKKLINDKVISGGMVPKVLSGTFALDEGVEKVHIVDAKIPHAILLEIFTNRGIGTEIVR